MKRFLTTYNREVAVATAILLLMLVMAFYAPAYFSLQNLADLFLSNMSVMIIALGMTLVILTGQIDISVGSVFAICSVVGGVSARAGLSMILGILASCLIGALCGAANGALTAYLRIPSIVVSLATMVALRDALRWQTQGAWIGGLPNRFQWFGLTQQSFTMVAFVLTVFLILAFAFSLRFLHAGRSVFATGSNEAAARIVGIHTEFVVFSSFTITGALTGLAAALNSVRFNQIPSNLGLGLELKVIAAVAVGGAAITGGSGTISGTVLGVILLGSIGTALTFLNISAYWENAIQGAVILGAIILNVLSHYREKHGNVLNDATS